MTIGPVRIWTRVRNPTCPVALVTGQKPDPIPLSFVELDLGVQLESPQLTLKKLCINNGSIHNKVTNFT